MPRREARAGVSPRLCRPPLAAIVALALAGLACERAAAPVDVASRLAADSPLHLVLVVVDTLRADFTAPYGAAAESTPELALWAERGVVFERARAQSSWTKISMASLFTSLWPRSHGVWGARDGLGDEAVTLAEVLRDAGFGTYGVQTNGWLHQGFGFHQGFDRYLFPFGGGDPRLGRPALWPHADLVLEEAERVLAGREHGRPFFLYVHFMDVHEYAAPPRFQRFGSDSEGAYRAAVRWVDDALLRLRRLLEREGVLDRTVIVLAADHGETFGEHGVHGHARNVLTPVLWVPLVVRFPFRVDPPVRVATQVRNVDLAPTLLELAGVPVPEGFEGRSLLPLMAGGVDGADRVTFAALGPPLFPDASVQASVSDGSWTLARSAAPPDGTPDDLETRAREPGASLLFDRRVDPGETANLWAREPAAAERMGALLSAHLRGPERGVAARRLRIEPEVARRLRAMGYLR